MSQCIKKWKVGTHIEVRGPFGSLQYSANKVLVYQVLAILIWILSWTSIHRLCWSFIVAMGFWSICYIILCLQLAGKGFAAFKCIYTYEKKNQNRINKNERKNLKIVVCDAILNIFCSTESWYCWLLGQGLLPWVRLSKEFWEMKRMTQWYRCFMHVNHITRF